VKTSRARQKIKHWININQREKAVDIGTRLVEKEARRAGVSLGKTAEESMTRVAREYGCDRWEDLVAALGYGKYSARQVVGKLAPASEPAPAAEPVRAPTARTAEGDAALKVQGVGDLLVYRAKCCNPIKAEATYPVRLTIHTDDRPGMLNDVTSILTGDKTNITSIEARTEAGRNAVIEMTLEVQNMKQLERILSAMRRVPGVRDVERVHQR